MASCMSVAPAYVEPEHRQDRVPSRATEVVSRTTPMATTDVVLVTGGAGFIGTALIPHLARFERPVIVVDSLLDQVHPGGRPPACLAGVATLVVGDAADAGMWDDLLIRCTPGLVVHLAAETGTGQSLTEATRHAMANVVGTTAMLDAFVKHRVTPAHMLLASSRAVYGEGTWIDPDGVRFVPTPRPHARLAASRWDHEDIRGRPAVGAPSSATSTQVNPCSVYGATKLAQEMIFRTWGAAFSVPTSVLRLQNVYGPGQAPQNPYTGITTLFHRLASRGRVLDVYEDGRIGRDFVFIDDVVAAFVAAVEAPPPCDEFRVLDVGTGTVTTILDAAECIAAMYGAPTPAISGRFRDGDVRFAVADISEAKRTLDWAPAIAFDEGNRLLSAWLATEGYLG